MEKLVSGCLILTTSGHPYRVISIHNADTEDVVLRARYVATNNIVSIWGKDNIKVVGPPVSSFPVSTNEEHNKIPSLEQRRNFLIRHLEKLERKVTCNLKDYDLIYKFYATITNPGEYKWFWKTLSESLTDPKKIAFPPEPKFVDDDNRRRFCSYSKFLKGPAKKYGLELDESEAERIAYLVGTTFPDSREYRFEIVRGEGVVTAYQETPGDWNSCMSESNQIWWYANNPDKVGCIKIFHDEEYCGRALLWTTDSGELVVDRVYPSDNGPQTIALHYHAEDQGWDWKNTQSSEDGCLQSGRTDYTTTLSTKRTRSWATRRDGYPYLDTFKYALEQPRAQRTVTLSIEPKRFVLNRTDGRWSFGGPDCYECEEGTDPQDPCEDRNGYLICRKCFNNFYRRVEYTHQDDTISGVFGKAELTRCMQCRNYFLKEHVVNRCCQKCKGTKSGQVTSSPHPLGLNLFRWTNV